MRDPRTMPVLRVVFTLADGITIERDWTMHDPDLPEWTQAAPPDWILDPLRSWPHPQDPITFTGRVREGHEDEARALLTETTG